MSDVKGDKGEGSLVNEGEKEIKKEEKGKITIEISERSKNHSTN